jgi:hypothetical protein
MNTENKNQWRIEIDKEHHTVNDPVLTGRQLLNLAGKIPIEEHLVYLIDKTRLLEDIGLEESVDLRQRGIERFITFASDRSFRFELDGRRQDWGADLISEPTLRKLAGVGQDYRVWQERRGEEDKQLEPGEMVPLTPDGVERFYTGRDDTNAGSTFCLLPQSDQRYIDEQELEIEEVEDGKEKGVIFRAYRLPEGRYDAEEADVLVILPAGYPDTAPDMFHTDPWLKLVGTGKYPKAADRARTFAGRRWQRWSRHNKEWRSGRDGIRTMLRRVDRALRGEC